MVWSLHSRDFDVTDAMGAAGFRANVTTKIAGEYQSTFCQRRAKLPDPVARLQKRFALQMRRLPNRTAARLSY